MVDGIGSGTVAQRRRTGWWLRPAAAIGVLVALELLALAGARRSWHAVRGPGPASLDEVVLLVVVVACAILGAWLVLSTTVACAAHLPGRLGHTARRWSRTLAPAVTRRVAAVLVGAALGATLAPATATGTAGGGGASPQRSPGFALTVPSTDGGSSPVPAPGWTPSRPVDTAPAVTRLVTTGRVPHSSEVVVHRGDTLWGIAQHHLGPGATEAEVAAAWPHWYAANRDVIGPDPDVLLPGQVLRAPEPSSWGGWPVRADR